MILTALKAATSELHARVELAMPSLDALATVRGYTDAIRLLHRFHAEWEPAIWSFAGVHGTGLVAHDRRKLPSLTHDLRALPADPAPRAPAPAAPLLQCAGMALGALYVLEGASLGGRIIQRHVAPVLGTVAARAGAYFDGYGSRTGAMWTAFGVAVAAYATRHDADDEIILGAVVCFGALEQWLRTPDVLGAVRPVLIARPG